MDTTRVEALIRFILAEAAQNEEWRFRELGPIHIIKYVYLADMYHAIKYDGKTYTGIPWRFHHLGPWDVGLYNEIPKAAVAIGADLKTFESKYSKDGKRWSLKGSHLQEDYYEQAVKEVPFVIAARLKVDIREFGQATNDLLHHVYRTLPMTNAAPGEFLNFSYATFPKKETAKGQCVGSTAKMTARAKKKEKQKKIAFHQRLLARKEARRENMVTPHPPNYDEVFFQGTAALNEMATGPIKEEEGVLEIDDSIWKNPWRQSVDLS